MLVRPKSTAHAILQGLAETCLLYILAAGHLHVRQRGASDCAAYNRDDGGN